MQLQAVLGTESAVGQGRTGDTEPSVSEPEHIIVSERVPVPTVLGSVPHVLDYHDSRQPSGPLIESLALSAKWDSRPITWPRPKEEAGSHSHSCVSSPHLPTELPPVGS